MSEKSKMHNKGMTSFFMTFGFIVLFVTGIILYIVPAGRVANWVEWTLFGLTKEQWGNIHILSGFMLLIAGIFHVYFNWKPLKKYFFSKTKSGINLGKELVISSVVVVVLMVGSVTEFPPFNYVFDFGTYISDSWVTDEKDEAPLGHAELLSFQSFTDKLKIDKEKALAELEKNGITVKADKDSLEKIAKENNVSPMEIYSHIRQFEPQKEEVVVDELTAEKVEELLEGKGVGRRDLAWLLNEFGLEREKADRRLKKNNITYNDGDSFHDVADRYDVSPMDIIKVVLVKKYEI